MRRAQAQNQGPLTAATAVKAERAETSAPAATAVLRQVDAAPPEAASPFVEQGPGDVTRALLAAQADDGRRVGSGLPLQGPLVTAAWRPYLKSFDHPLPPWFDTRSASGDSGGMAQ
ncbi:DUF3613 domain-containing protein [Bordetella avium]|nr:DUF3613 domain-containing protein [Bordetella avium]